MQDRAWMYAAASFLAAQFLFCAYISIAFDFHEPPPFAKYASTAAGLVMLIASARALWSLRHRPEKPALHLLSLDWSAHRGFALAMVLVWLQFVALTWAKAILPMATSMWADIPLANADAALFGRDAWRLFPASNPIIDTIYMAWLPTVGAVFAWLYFSSRQNRATAILALFLTIGILGTFGQYVLPSGGPIFFERLGFGDRFSDMPYAWQTHRAADKLWNAYQGHYISFATGISAFPSIHVAAVSWIAIVFRSRLAVFYALLIFLGSVALGWHYAVDGIAGAFGAVLCYALAKRILDKLSPARATALSPALR